MKIKNLILALVSVLGMASAVEANATDNKKVLVVYYSLSGNTREMAKQIQKETNADIFELETVQNYPSEYRATTEQAKKEISEGFKPALKNKISNIKDYDIIFLGSPCWWSTYAPAVLTFLCDYDLSGKKIIPFMTHEGSGFGRTISDIKKQAPKATVLEGKAIRGSKVSSSQKEVKEWIENLNINK